MKVPFSSIGRTYRHINRYRQLITILVKYGFHDVVDQLSLSRYLELGKSVLARRPPKEIERIPRATRIRLIIEEMGTTFIKLGQVLSTRPDLVPQDFINELKKLQDEVPPFPTDQAIKTIEAELEGDVGALFKEISPEPTASASIAQVYRAVLPEGEEVAVKVRRPGIEKAVAVDIEIMLNLARLAEAHLPGMETLQPAAIVEEFARQIDNEMNFHVEAYNIERFAENAKSVDALRTIRVFRDYSTRAILTMEFIHGTKISEKRELEEDGVDTARVARIGADAVLKQIFEDGFFHGDPHPGNLLVTEDQKVCFLDFGMMGSLDSKSQDNLAAILINVVHRDDERLTRSVLNIATNADEIENTSKLRRAISNFASSYAYLPLDQMDAGKILQDLLDLLIDFGIKLPPEFYLLVKALVTIEGVARELDPNFVFMDHVKPYVEQLIMRRYDPRRLAKDVGRTSAEFYRLARDMPEEIRALLRFVKRGELKIDLETKSLEPVMKTWDRDANRLAFAIVSAAMLMSSALIIMGNVPPMWYGVSIPGLVGLGISFLMGLRLLIAIIVRGHL